ncbi:hypothetical protein [Elstera litoralis]|uniref:hypothetical protein n=1 Tax=Elstera litoralis TaxID=552518 RepID=UPI0012ED322B|nr:hypothetical protein [Elstera litoralis]
MVITLILSFDIALVSLIKSSVLFMALPVLVILSLHDTLVRRALPVALLAFIAFTLLLLLAVGQQPAHWGAFYQGYFDLSRGYNADMGLPTPRLTQVLWGVGVAVIVASFAVASLTDRLVALMLGGCLLVAYKASFHRHGLNPDVAFMTLAIVGLGQLLTGRGRFFGASHRSAVVAVVAVAVVGTLAIVAPRLIPDGPAMLLAHAQHRLSFFLVPGEAKAAREADRAWFQSALAAAKASFPFPDAQGTLDVFPWNFGLGMASGLPLAPRPAFQAYFTTTRLTTERNAAFFASASAPQSILYTFAPIDNRFAALEDPLTLRAFKQYYALAARRDGHLLLTRRPQPLREEERGCVQQAFTLGQPITLPATAPGEALWAQVELTQTWSGQALGFLFGPPVLGIELAEGTQTHAYRFLQTPGAIGFLLSPALVSTDTAQAFFDGANGGVVPHSVRFSVMSDTPGLWLKPGGTISLCRLAWSAP